LESDYASMLNSALEMWLVCFECMKEDNEPVSYLHFYGN